MKRTFLLSLAAIAFSGLAQAAPINLVTNGSFEQGAGGIGSFTGWQTVLGDSSTFVDSSGQTGIHAGQASDGLWSAYFGSTASSGGSSISENLTTVANQMYLLTFDLANDNGGAVASNWFLATVAGKTALTATNIPAQDYVHEQFLFVASSSTSVLKFSAANDQAYLQLDKVSVSPVPEPASVASFLLGLSVISFGLLHRGIYLRKW